MIWGGRWEGASGLGTHVHPWLIHVNVWQNQYSIVKQNKVKIKIKKNKDWSRKTELYVMLKQGVNSICCSVFHFFGFSDLCFNSLTFILYKDIVSLVDIYFIVLLLPWIVSSVQFSRSVMSYSLRPHELQHTRPPCPSPTPRVHSNSHLLSQWCHPAISSSVGPFSSCPQSLPASESFPMSQLFAWGGQSYLRQVIYLWLFHKLKTRIKNQFLGTSQVVQSLRICLPM